MKGDEDMGKIESALSSAQHEVYDKGYTNWADAKSVILKYFRKYDIPESEYKPYMANNILPGILLK